MIYRFRFKVLIRLAIICIMLGLFMYFVFATHQYLRSIYFFAFAIVGVIELFWFLNRTNRDLATFFESIIESDFTTTFTEKGKHRSSRKLYRSLNQITQNFREIGAEREAQYHLLEMMLQQVRIGIISFDKKGKINMVNNSFKKLVGINHLSGLEALNNHIPELYNTLLEIQPNENRQLKARVQNQLLQLSILASLIRIRNTDLKLVTLQNIRSELEAGEVEAWQKLIRVLAHEIMNSVTPITSLTDTILEILEKDTSMDLENDEAVQKVYTGLKAIKNRSQALNRFTTAYQRLTQVPEPEFSLIRAREFTGNLKALFSAELKGTNTTMETFVSPEDLEFLGDKDLLGQAIINLIKNAVESIKKSHKKKGKIVLRINREREDTRISLQDNGIGIPAEELDKIFVPFYTTRKKGSGIGLALVKQIVQLHNGVIKVDSTQGKSTTFDIII